MKLLDQIYVSPKNFYLGLKELIFHPQLEKSLSLPLTKSRGSKSKVFQRGRVELGEQDLGALKYS